MSVSYTKKGLVKVGRGRRAKIAVNMGDGPLTEEQWSLVWQYMGRAVAIGTRYAFKLDRLDLSDQFRDECIACLIRRARLYQEGKGAWASWVQYGWRTAWRRCRSLASVTVKPVVLLDHDGHHGRAEPPESRAEIRDDLERVRKCLPMLTPREQRAIEAVAFQGKDWPEIAQAEHCSENNIRDAYTRGVRKLREILCVA